MAGIPWATSTRQVSGMELQPLSTSEREMFNQLFWSLSPVGGRVTGQQVKGLFMKSALPQHVLAHIWSLVDTDADGHIDCMQFSLAMHLVRNAMCGCPPPSALPPHILQAFVAPMPPTTTETHNGVSHMLHSAKRHSLAFEESRRANMEAGEAELTRRRAFQRQRQQEEKEREERDREQQRQRRREKEEECRRKDLEAERDRMRRDVEKLKVRHTELNRELNHWQARKEALEQRMEEMRKDASVFRNELDSTTQMIVQLQAETDSLMEQLQRAQKDVQELQVERQSLEEQTRQGKQSQSNGNQEAWGGKAMVEKQRLSLVQRFADLRVIEKQIYQSKGMEESSSMQKADHLEEWNNEIQGATGGVEKRPNVAYLLDKTKDLLTKKGTLETSNQANDSTTLPRDPFLPVTSEEGSTTAWVDRNGMSSGKLGFDSHFDPFGTSETTSVNDDDSWADFSNL
uniref:Uncharacterized protein n=1 Tax=Eptatretus burgeri TaxID=7764 RepID=A0A8C4QA24_EPTBU